MKILTFDVEDWFHILDFSKTETEKEWIRYESRLRSNMEKIFDLLVNTGQKAAFFVLGWIARKYPDIIREISELGYEIGTHSDMHQLVYKQNKSEFRKDLERSVKSIEDIIGKKVRTYRAPGFSIKAVSKWAFEELIRVGIEIDCSIFPAKRGHGGFENFGTARPVIIEADGMKIKEFPINVFSFLGLNVVFSGGGYFRIFPYWAIKKMMSKSGYVMTYFHPRDFDPSQPFLKELPFVRKFKSYYGIRGAYKKLQKLLKDFAFIDLQEADKAIDWEKVEIIKL